jgi:hypothetical protein
MQPSGLDAVANCMATESQLDKLPPRYDPVLLVHEPPDLIGTCRSFDLAAHSRLNASRGAISSPCGALGRPEGLDHA